MGKINILNDNGTAKATIEFNGSSDETLNTSHLVGTTENVQTSLDSKLAASTDGVVIPSLSSDPGSGSAGQLYYDSTNKTIRFHNGDAWANVYTPPFDADNISGLVGWYKGENWTGSQWTDASTAGNHATSITGTITKSTINGTDRGAAATFTTLSGGASDGIVFPSAILPSTFTLFHVARYNVDLSDTVSNTDRRGRIFDGVLGNWLSSFWGGKTGVFYHDGWITQSDNDLHGNYWVQSTDMNVDGSGGSRVRSRSKNANSGNWYEDTGGGNTNKQLTINQGAHPSERSVWSVAEVIVYNRTLTQTEYNTVEDYLAEKYGI